jgi:hypothetical protein
MKNLNQATQESNQTPPLAPDQKLLSSDSPSLNTLTANYPLEGVSAFYYELNNIGDTMMPEIPSGSRAFVDSGENRMRYDPADMPASGTLVLGMLKSGHVVFGVFHTPVFYPKMGLWQIRPINPKYPPAHYLPEHFHWLCVVECVDIMSAEGYLELSKRLEYTVNDAAFNVESLAA